MPPKEITINLEEVKNGLRIEHDMDDEILRSDILTAEIQTQEAVSGLGHTEFYAMDGIKKVYEVVVKIKVKNLYEEKRISTDGLIHTLRGLYREWSN